MIPTSLFSKYQELKNLIKVWWHCLWTMIRDIRSCHRMVKYTYWTGRVHWACDCGYCDNKQHGNKPFC